MALRLDRACGINIARKHMLSTKVSTLHALEAEQLQVGIYGPGGLYLPHLDALRYMGVRKLRYANLNVDANKTLFLCRMINFTLWAIWTFGLVTGLPQQCFT